MISKNSVLVLPLAFLLTLGLASCAAEPGGSATDEGSNSDSGPASEGDGEAGTTSGLLDDNGYAIPGQVVDLKLGESVTYYSYPKLTMEDAQRVTIQSFEYIEKSELPAGSPLEKIDNGILVLTLSWENVLGDVQSNQGYIVATLDSGEVGGPRAFMENRLKNGRVDPGETRSGVFTIDIPRGKTTLTIVDYQQAPVARMQIDTAK